MPFISAVPVASPRSTLGSITPIGFILTKQLLITVRFEESEVVSSVVKQLARPGALHPNGAGVFVALAEEMVEQGRPAGKGGL